MTGYFKVTEASSLHRDFIAYRDNAKAIRELVKDFSATHAIESTTYWPTDEALYIVPTEKDVSSHGSILCAPIESGLRKFKVNSRIGKSWLKALKDANLKVIRKPPVAFYFRSFSGGRIRSRLFSVDDQVYCSLDPFEGDPPEGLTEMNASEFFKIIEDSERG
ncbi:hypothetical protein [Paenibacillus sp. PDC88]|uniref:hypothetical protein n=1 Tax=Paenibacillus sp. PDC88 TaxID=1884375 RepID=UPI00089B22DF|nr:hypothetical protein [Paenibacillus sp. PDC88]SDW31431.1 hypothetical protein SAMN05518848_101977 [Paenibacillus sp. PDC88]